MILFVVFLSSDTVYVVFLTLLSYVVFLSSDTVYVVFLSSDTVYVVFTLLRNCVQTRRTVSAR